MIVNSRNLSKASSYPSRFEANRIVGASYIIVNNYLQLIMFDFDCLVPSSKTCFCIVCLPRFELLIAIYPFHYFGEPPSYLE